MGLLSSILGLGSTNDEMEKIYTIDPELGGVSHRANWYKQKPYSLVFTNRAGSQTTFNLPISPSNLNVTTHWATNIVSTMYGTVEEHSEQRYYDIQISGSTGISPRYYNTLDVQKVTLKGRGTNFDIFGFLPSTGGFARRTSALLRKTAQNAIEAIGVKSAPVSAVNYRQTGYIAFHNLYRFLLTYKKDASGESSDGKRKCHPLSFINFKDNSQYDVAITGFQLNRDASNPMLYNYNITMRAYNLRSPEVGIPIQFDIRDRKEELGLNGLSTSLFAEMATRARKAKNAVYAGVAAVKGFGS